MTSPTLKYSQLNRSQNLTKRDTIKISKHDRTKSNDSESKLFKESGTSQPSKNAKYLIKKAKEDKEAVECKDRITIKTSEDGH